MSGKKVVLAMSGGVDSSVAAALLLREGYDVVGCFMRNGAAQQDEAETCSTSTKKHKQGCCSVNDAADARRVADRLGIPLYVLNFEQEFGRIIDYFVAEYDAGRTPNPCVRCNDWLKFGRLHDYAEAVGADYVASGHYARIEHTDAGPRLLRGVDRLKDQSYVLFGASEGRLAHMLLPVGGYEKHEIRQLAEELDLPVFNKPDSQEICFVPDQNYASLVDRRGIGTRPGEVVDTAGNKLGEHDGFQRYTIGQRRGLRLAVGRPIYVVDTDAETNRVVVGDKTDVLSDGLIASSINVLSPEITSAERRCEAKIRYNAEPVPAAVRRTGEDELRVEFDEPQAAVAPGQAVVCYADDTVLAGGWIDRATKPATALQPVG
ncbi:MAG: tRNA 2-thiouridine(34) synthase MnmA [Planctomycetota bacterium]